jgi:tetratricopeptide (TPR) repeat protein
VALTAICWSAVLQAAPAHASQQTLDEVARLLEQGRLAQAAKQAEIHLKQDPGDLQMRFMQGVIAAEQKQSKQAIEIFSGLTRDYPDLPEPYNNLAVVYAAEGKEREAVAVLEQAVRANPGYATAHENLGDLYARMAAGAYAKALQLDEARKAVQVKMALVAQVVSRPSGERQPAAARADAAKSERLASLVAGAQSAARVEAVRPGGVAGQAGGAPASQEEVPPAGGESLQPAPERSERALKSTSSAEVEAAVNAWAEAWAAKDLEHYLGAYSEGFTPVDGSSFSAWKETRRQRIVGKPSISVSLQDLVVSVDGDRATAQFRQHYAAGALKTMMRKTLEFKREQGHWRIVREGAGA